VLLLPMVAFVLPSPPLMLLAGGAGEGGLLTIALIGLVLLVLGVLGLAWILAFTNLLEWKLWEFARLDGLCPSCRQWRFGRIKRPGIITCAHCGATLEFVRADERQRPPESWTATRAGWSPGSFSEARSDPIHRVLLHWNTEKPAHQIVHVYIEEAATLRPDRSKLPPVDWNELEEWIAEHLNEEARPIRW
jgi:hypothetical protein